MYRTQWTGGRTVCFYFVKNSLNGLTVLITDGKTQFEIQITFFF